MLIALLAGCGAPLPAPVAKPDPTQAASYIQDIASLSKMNQEVSDLLRRNNLIAAGERLSVAQPFVAQLLAVPNPSLSAMEAASDSDALYARVLLLKKQAGYARMLYQKNRSRWKNWVPESDNTKRRLAEAEAGISECDRLIR